MSKINILFPVETINRELDFRLLLAVLHSNPRRRIYIGQHDVLDGILPMMKGGIYLGKNCFKTLFPGVDLSDYWRLKAQGFTVVHLDEEGAFFVGDEARWRENLDYRLDPHVLEKEDFICTWGEFQAAYYRKRNQSLAHNIRVTGHPRFDLYKEEYRQIFQEDARRLRDEFGSFLLINTNFTFANPAKGQDYIFSFIAEEGARNLNRRNYLVGVWSEQTRTMAEVVQTVFLLSDKFADRQIILRPHPAEGQEFYQSAFQTLENVHVLHRGPVSPWIIASELVIHDGCTTAIEAFLSDTPIINYQQGSESEFQQRIPNLFGIPCGDPAGIVAAVDAILSGSTDVVHRLNKEAHSLLANFEIDSVRALLAVLEEAEEHIAKPLESPNTRDLLFVEGRRLAKEGIKKTVRPFLPAKQQAFVADRIKFPGFNRDVISRKFKVIQELTGKQIEFAQLNDSLIVVDAMQ